MEKEVYGDLINTNKSLKFIINRMIENKIKPISAKEECLTVLKLSQLIAPPINSTLEFKGSELIVEIRQADDDFSDFDYYASHYEHNDGTMLFVNEGIKKIVFNWLTVRSYPLTKISSSDDLVGVKKIVITIGDIIVCQNTDKSPVKEKPWMTNKLEIFIPAHFELIKG